MNRKRHILACIKPHNHGGNPSLPEQQTTKQSAAVVRSVLGQRRPPPNTLQCALAFQALVTGALAHFLSCPATEPFHRLKHAMAKSSYFTDSVESEKQRVYLNKNFHPSIRFGRYTISRLCVEGEEKVDIYTVAMYTSSSIVLNSIVLPAHY